MALAGEMTRVAPEPMALDLEERPYGLAAFLGGMANVVMQFGQPGVAYGVMESKVQSGSLMHHPFKRLRTTLAYLGVALAGTDEERAAYKAAVDKMHARVRSGPDSPVKYNAFDPNLQLWVAACLYWGATDVVDRVCGPWPDERADQFYVDAARLATTLQVPAEIWPADRAAFDTYWNKGLAEVSLDPAVRTYALDLINLAMFPLPVRLLFRRFHRWIVTGVLPPQFRAELELPWSERNERWHARFLRSAGALAQLLPRKLRGFPLNYYLWDLRRRIKSGRPLL